MVLNLRQSSLFLVLFQKLLMSISRENLDIVYLRYVVKDSKNDKAMKAMIYH